MNFNFDSLMDTISNLRERGAEYALSLIHI